MQAALDSGEEVTIHEKPVVVDGWTGAGYAVIDPNTGAGGYLIDGGANGAWLAIALGLVVLMAVTIIDLIAAYLLETLVFEALEFVASFLINLLIFQQFDKQDAANLAILQFFSTILVVGVLLSLGYLSTLAMFSAVLMAGFGALGFLIFGKADTDFLKLMGERNKTTFA